MSVDDPKPSSKGALQLEVELEDQGLRLDVYLVRRVPSMTRSEARRLTEAGRVWLNGRVVRKGQSVRVGDDVLLEEMPEESDFEAEPDPDLQLTVLYDGDGLVAIDKPAGVPSHPLRAGETGTVAGALVARYPEMASVGFSSREPGILHRLDTDTSGVMLAAKEVAVFDAVRELFRRSALDKTYLALVAGCPIAPQTFVGCLATDPKRPKRVVVIDQESRASRLKARPATTELLRVVPVGAFSLLEVRARSAGRHQVRAHLSHAGHPLVGDRVYRGPEVAGLDRHFLHASVVSLVHPMTGRRLRFESPLPDELRAVLDMLGDGAYV